MTATEAHNFVTHASVAVQRRYAAAANAFLAAHGASPDRHHLLTYHEDCPWAILAQTLILVPIADMPNIAGLPLAAIKARYPNRTIVVKS